MNIKKITAAILALVITVSGTVFAAQTTKNEENPKETEYSSEYQAYEKMAEYISNMYVDDTYTKEDIINMGLSKLLEDNDPMLIELLKSTFESLDKYSEFYTADEYKAYMDKTYKISHGIGISMSIDDEGYVEIVGFTEENSEAEKAGLKVGDKIFKVDGTNVQGWQMQDVKNVIAGEEGTTVEITVLRDGKEIELTAKRCVNIIETTVFGGILEDDIGYIRISSFGLKTAEEFENILQLMRERNVKSIILDLRNNAGGAVSSVISIAQSIVPKGKIIDVKCREPQYNEVYMSNLDKKEFDFAILVNEHTASASEILASAMQESGGGKLIGTKTFGKGIIQKTFMFTNGAAFKMTTAQYVTRNGNKINGIGLTPDIYVENVTEKIDVSEYTPFDFSTRSALGMSDNNVKAAKERLSILGYYDEDDDSDFFDVKLKESVFSFQQANNMFAYGVLDVPTQKRIEEVFSDVDVKEDIQFQTAYELLSGKTDK